MKQLILLAAALVATPVFANTQEASIPFVSSQGIRDFRAVDNETVYIQGQNNEWYLGKTFAPCPDLPFAQSLGFETRGVDSFDRFSALIVRGKRCPMASLVKSGPPPRKGDKAG